MLKDITLLIVGAVFGLGPALAAMAAPLYFPEAPRWIWHYAFWLGLVMFFLMVIDTGCILLFHDKIRTGTIAFATLGVFLIALSVIHQTASHVVPSDMAAKKAGGEPPRLEADDPNRPTLLDLFMTDFSGKFTGATANYPREFVFKDSHRERFYVNHYYDYMNNSNFLAFYIDTVGWVKIVEHIAKHNKEIAGERLPLGYDAKVEGDSSIIKMDEIPFSGRIFVYVPAIFDAEVIGDLTKQCRENGCALQLRGTEYENLMKENIRKYKSIVPVHYEIEHQQLVAVAPEINLRN